MSRSVSTGWLGLLFVVGGAFLLPQIAEAQPAAKATTRRKVEEKTLVTNDNIQLRLTYYPSPVGKEAAVVVLIHGAKGTRQIWKKTAEILQDNDYAVIAFDMRGHGESSGGPGSSDKITGHLKPQHYQAMVTEDLEAVKRFLFDEHQKEKLNMNKLALMVADDLIPIALNFTELDWEKAPYDDAAVPAQRTPRGQDVRALVLFSPVKSILSVTTGQPLKAIKNIGLPVLMVVGEKDKDDKGATKTYEEALSSKQFFTYRIKDANFRGTNLLDKGLKVDFKIDTKSEVKPLEYAMLVFLEKYVKRANSEWRDRQSPLFSGK